MPWDRGALQAGTNWITGSGSCVGRPAFAAATEPSSRCLLPDGGDLGGDFGGAELLPGFLKDRPAGSGSLGFMFFVLEAD